MGLLVIGADQKPTRVQALVLSLPSDQEGQHALIKNFVDELAPTHEADLAAAVDAERKHGDERAQAQIEAGQKAVREARSELQERIDRLTADRDAIREENKTLRAEIEELKAKSETARPPL